MATCGQSLTDRERERIRKLAGQGMSVRKVAGVMMCSPTTVQKVIRTGART